MPDSEAATAASVTHTNTAITDQGALFNSLYFLIWYTFGSITTTAGIHAIATASTARPSVNSGVDVFDSFNEGITIYFILYIYFWPLSFYIFYRWWTKSRLVVHFIHRL